MYAISLRIRRAETSSSGEGAEREGRGERMEVVCGAKKKKMDRISFHNHTYLRPTLPFRFPPFPEHHFAHTHTHTPCTLVHSLLKLHQMSHQESLATALQPDEEFEKFWKIFVERLRTEVAEAWRGRG